MGNWDATNSDVKLDIDFKKLGFIPKSLIAKGLAIDKFQSEFELDLSQPITIPGGKGYLLILK